MTKAARIAALTTATLFFTALPLAIPPAQAATNAYVMFGDIEGDAPGSTCESGVCTELYHYQGSASCTADCNGAPTSGDITIQLAGPLKNPSDCISKRVSGSLDIESTDPLYPGPIAASSLSGRSRDHKGYALHGMVSSGLFAGHAISVFVNHPPSPCSGGSTTATVSMSP